MSQNNGNQNPSDMASCPQRMGTSTTPLQIPKHSQCNIHIPCTEEQKFQVSNEKCSYVTGHNSQAKPAMST